MKTVNARRLSQERTNPSSSKVRPPPGLFRVNEAAFSYYQRLDRVRRFVGEHYPERLILADVAEIAGMEPTAFSRFFRRKTGLCFRDWLAVVRVDKAKELMSENNLPMREVALKVGYCNLRSFQRVFLRFTGLSPIEYKHSVRPS